MFNLFKKKKKFELEAMTQGNLINIEKVNDPTFSEKMLGDGIAIMPNNNDSIIDVVSPASGTVTALFPTGHAFGITCENGIELLIHIGLDTVNAKGEGFKLNNIKQGDKVKAGQIMVTVDLKLLRKDYELPVILVITNPSDKDIKFIEPQRVMAKQNIIK